MKAYVFPGQGSQKQGMGQELFDNFRDIVSEADEILGYSIKDLCLNDPENLLARTDYTQPALFTINALTYLNKVEETGEKPDFTAGHSLGEYNALLASGAFNFRTGLRLVKERGRLMALARNGKMAAIIGLDKERIEQILEENGFFNLSIANYNSPSQIVISGKASEIEEAQKAFSDVKGAMYIPLKVSGAFHSKYMEDAAVEFGAFLDNFEFSSLEVPVISNADAVPYKDDNVGHLLKKQIISPVRWTDSIRFLIDKGVDEFEEIGPGKVLTSLIRDIKRNIK